MYKTGDYLVYTAMGICKVVDVREENFIDGCKKEFYVLESYYASNMTAYYPTDEDGRESKLRDVLKKEEVIALIDSMADDTITWIDDVRVRNQTNRKILMKAEPEKLIRLIQSIYKQKIKLTDQGKKFPAEDEKVMLAAEKYLYDEFAFVLQLKPKEVLPFIVQHIPT